MIRRFCVCVCVCWAVTMLRLDVQQVDPHTEPLSNCRTESGLYLQAVCEALTPLVERGSPTGSEQKWPEVPPRCCCYCWKHPNSTEPNRTGVIHQDHTINFTFSDVTHLIWEFPGFYLSLKVDFQPFIAADASIKGPVCSFSNSRILIFTLLMTSQDKNSEIFMIPISA